jgi:tRNA threonylcarbamoyladenosine biosynthesis protein TsaB
MTSKPLILSVETSSRIGSVALAQGPDILAESAFSAPLTHSQELFPTILQLLSRFKRSPKQIEQIYISIGPGSFTGLRIAVTLAKMIHLANQTKIIPIDTMDVIAANVIHIGAEEQSALLAPGFTGGSLDHNVFQNPSDEPQVTSNKIVAAILDAKRGQFFIAAYAPFNYLAPDFTMGSLDNRKSYELPVTNHTIWQKILQDTLITAEEFLTRFASADKPLWLLGDGLLYYKDKFNVNNVHFFDESLWSARASKVHQLGWQSALAGHFAEPLALQPHYLRGPDVTLKKNV